MEISQQEGIAVMPSYQNPSGTPSYTAVNSTLDNIVLGKVDNPDVLAIAPDGPYALSCTFNGGTITNMTLIGNNKTAAGDLLSMSLAADAKWIGGGSVAAF